MLKEFKQFILRGNVLDLAVGVMIGAAFSSVVNALVSDILTPFIGAIAAVPDFSNLSFTINDSIFNYGHFLNTLISFLLVATAIFFFIIKPLKYITKRTTKETITTKKCHECLSEIPLLAKRCSHCTQPQKPSSLVS